jgi:hypothetical protein
MKVLKTYPTEYGGRMNEITKWDYDESVNRMKPLVVKWRTMTIEMLQELWTARENMKAQGARTDLTSGKLARGWETYCEEIGLPKRTANRWLSQYDAVEQKLIEAPTEQPNEQGFIPNAENICKMMDKATDEYHIRGKAVTEGLVEDWDPVLPEGWNQTINQYIYNCINLPELVKINRSAEILVQAIAVFNLRIEQAIGNCHELIEACDRKIKELS